ncbi:MAG: lytic murein transglycosylase B [Pseudomonadota bacterium]|nr:lytic murein transglycosylase B [Pseudomonadota bacterium]
MKWIFTLNFLASKAGFFFGILLLIPLTSWSLNLESENVRDFINQLETTHGFERKYIEQKLENTEFKQSIIDAISRPAEGVLTWGKYRNIFIQPERILAGVEFFKAHKETIEKIGKETGVPPEILLGIIGVESYYGRFTGKYKVIDALVTLGFNYPPRAKFFLSELSHVFRLAREEGIELDTFMGSYAGAMGPPQFIPSSYRAYAVDGDGDGKRDLLSNWDDILHSVANYFVEHNWQEGKPVATIASTMNKDQALPFNTKLKLESTIFELKRSGVIFSTTLEENNAAGIWELEGNKGKELWVGFQNLYVITRYNRSIMYALATWQLGQAVIKQTSVE